MAHTLHLLSRMGIRKLHRPALLAAALGVAACAGLLSSQTKQQKTTSEAPITSLVAACGQPEIPRYIKYHELDTDRVTLLRAPTLQRGKPGAPIVLKQGISYLYSIAVDGTFLVAENRPFATAECGHPNLTGGKPARLSGELVYNPDLAAWVIDNKSGRYGYQSSRQRGHLSSARQLLERIGVRYTDGRPIRLVERWFEPRRDQKNLQIDCARPVLKNAPQHVDSNTWRGVFVASMGFAAPENTPVCAQLRATAE